MHYSTSVPMLISRQFGDEIVLANYESGLYYSLTGTGADIWLGLTAGRSREDLVHGLAGITSDGAEQLSSQVGEFIDTLLAEGIIVPVSQAPDPQPWWPMSAPFEPPTVERFDDLRDLLLLDPIHDVSDAGWPLRANDAS